MYTSAEFELNVESLIKFYDLAGKLVYYITGLSLTDDYEVSPCDGDDSRWFIHDGACGVKATNFTDADTQTTIESAISSASNTNPYVLDVDVTASGDACTDTDGDTIGAKVTVGNKCYENIHPDEYNVYDFDEWSGRHNGNDRRWVSLSTS